MNPRPASHRNRRLAATAALLVLAGAALVWWLGRPPVSTADVERLLERTAGAGRLHFTVQSLDTLHREGATTQVAVVAKASAIEPLYVKADTADFLARAFHANAAATLEARRLLAANAASPAPGVLPEGDAPADPYRATVLQVATPAGASFSFQGIIEAHRSEQATSLSLASGGMVGGGPQGEARTAFPGPVFVAGDPQDEGALRRQLSDLDAFCVRLARREQVLRSAKAADADERRRAFLAAVAPGRIFRGVATEGGLQQGTTLYLEIVGIGPESAVRALLRNEGGWLLARPFEGDWADGQDPEGPTLSLSSAPRDAVRGAGPFLEEAQAWSFVLHSDATPILTGETRRYHLRFEPLSPQQGAAAAELLGREYASAQAATRAGTVYLGTAAARGSTAVEPVLLHFGPSATGLDATLESTTQPCKRHLRGTVLTNARRSGGEPIVLETDQVDAAAEARATSVFGDPEGLDLRLGVQEGGLQGGGARFTYRLAPATAADLGRLEAARLERTARLLEVLRPGIAYDGVLREEQGFTSAVRLQVEAVDRGSGAVTARIASRGRWGVYRAFQGSIDPSGSLVILGARARSKSQPDDSFDVPFLKNADPATLHLALGAGVLTGRIEGDNAWTIEFQLGAFMAARTKAGAPVAPGDEGASYPPPPKEPGAYLLVAGAWSPLPRNQGKVVTETIKPDSNLHLTLNALDALNEGIGLITREKDKEKVSYFEFDGKDPRPSTGEPFLTILVVAADPKALPAVELVAEDVLKDGKRRVLIRGTSASPLHLGDVPLATYVRPFAPGCLLLTTTAALDPGTYVLGAETGYELHVE